ncbi:MAG: LETM1 domain-containing protein [Deltaproteobacteria bacterium]|nr:LETM1 domain-containing protein [Deltaproteobacteria bacterium]
MNFNSPGWFDQYLKFRTETPFSRFLPSHGIKILEQEGIHNEMDQEIYSFLQPTGLLYGSPVTFPFPDQVYPNSQYHDSLERLILGLLESIFAVLMADRKYQLEGLEDTSDPLRDVAEIIQTYYSTPPEGFVPKKSLKEWIFSLFTKPPSDTALFEKYFVYRVTQGQSLNVLGLFFNNFLFLDVYHCLLLQRKVLMGETLGPELVETLNNSHLGHRETLMKLIIVTAYSNDSLEREEKLMIQGFLKRSRLPKPVTELLAVKMNTGLTLNEVEIATAPWLIRRYFLEVVIMMTLLDRVVTKEEDELLKRLVERLGLWGEELDQSRIAQETFLFAQGDNLQFFQKKPNLFNIKNRLKEKAGMAVRKNMNRVVNEIKETKELSQLLMKSSKTQLNPEEKKKVHDQLMDILKTIPALAIFALPGGGIILPVIMKLLPFNILPSSFEEKE